MLRFEGGIRDRRSISWIRIQLKLRVTRHHRDTIKYYLIQPISREKIGLTRLNDSVVRPIFFALVTSVYTTHSLSGFLAFIIILLSQVCLSKRPFLQDINGGSLKISLNNGCCCARCHSPIGISLGFRTVGQYCVLTKGKIRFFLFFPVGGGPVDVLQIRYISV